MDSGDIIVLTGVICDLAYKTGFASARLRDIQRLSCEDDACFRLAQAALDFIDEEK